MYMKQIGSPNAHVPAFIQSLLPCFVGSGPYRKRASWPLLSDLFPQTSSLVLATCLSFDWAAGWVGVHPKG